jgi:3-oxoacyl-[acyl-carrier protein] reductase
MQLEGLNVAITGAAAGIGLSIAQRLAAQGSRLALLDINDEALAAAAASLDGDSHITVNCNVASEPSVAAAFDQIHDHLGRLDVLVNNAGITRDALLIKRRDGVTRSRMSFQDWKAVLDVNLDGVFLCGREAADTMSGQEGGGIIINISSISRAGNIGQSNYSASKAAVLGVTVTWARELARHGIRVNAISPGFIGTEMVGAIRPDVLEKLKKSIPAGRLGEPDEIAHTVQFIIENDYISGRNLEIDGGLRF